MTTTEMTRWSGIANIAAGVLFAAFTLLHPAGRIAGGEAALVLGSPWAEIHTLGIAAWLFTVVGLVGLYVPRAGEFPLQWTYGFLLALFGTALFTGIFYADGYLLPHLAQYTPDLLRAGGPLSIQFTLFGVVTFLAGVALWSGYLLFYSVASRRRVIPFRCCITIMLGALWVGIRLAGYGVRARLGDSLMFGVIDFDLIFGLFFAAGLIWVGVLTLRGLGVPDRPRAG